jgi:hypothetical protein
MTANNLFKIVISLLLLTFCLIGYLIYDTVYKTYVFLSAYEDMECETY